MSCSLWSHFENHLQSLSLEPTILAFPKSLSAPNSLYQASPFLLKIDSNNLKISIAYNKGLFLSHCVSVMGQLGATI